MFSFFADPEAAWFTGREPYTSIEQAQKKVQGDLEAIAAGTAFAWALVPKEAKRDVPIGVVALFKWDKLNQNVELGYIMGRPSWGQGFLTESLPPVLRFAFEVMKVHRVDAHVDARNTASIRLLERAGFVREGAQREKSRDVTGAFGDLVNFGLLDREWRAR